MFQSVNADYTPVVIFENEISAEELRVYLSLLCLVPVGAQ